MNLLLLCQKSVLKIPFFQSPVQAGFPSPAQDYIEKTLDLNELCIQHPAATYFVRATGESMVDAGIFPDDTLIVDRAISPKNGDIVIASVSGQFTVKKLQLKPCLKLLSMNTSARSNYPNIELNNDEELEVFGVVTFVLHSLHYSSAYHAYKHG